MKRGVQGESAAAAFRSASSRVRYFGSLRIKERLLVLLWLIIQLVASVYRSKNV